MQFRIIREEGYKPVEDSGYKPMFDAEGRPVGFCVSAEMRKAYGPNYIDNRVDDLYDGADALCEGEDGNLYAVLWGYSDGVQFPGVWQRVEPIGEKCFCNDCGHEFYRASNHTACPECGSWDIYPDTDAGHEEAWNAFQRYDAQVTRD